MWRLRSANCYIRVTLLYLVGSPSNTMSPGSRPTSLPSGILIHPAVWPQQMGRKLGLRFGGGVAGFLPNTMWPRPRLTFVPSFTLATIHQVSNRTDTQTRQRRANRFTNGRPKMSTLYRPTRHGGPIGLLTNSSGSHNTSNVVLIVGTLFYNLITTFVASGNLVSSLHVVYSIAQ